MKYERWRSRRSTTVALRLFRAHHTELNSYFWSLDPAIVCAGRRARTASDTDATDSVFALTHANVKRVPSPLGSWKANFKGAQLWLRLSALMALASYFELYLNSAIELALESDPAVTVGGSRCVDGVVLLKRRSVAYDYATSAKAVSKGPWLERTRNFERLFGAAPAALHAASGDLDWIRRTRNSVGHTFGRAVGSYTERLVTTVAPLEPLSTNRLQRLLAVVDDVAGAIDRFLLQRHLGEFEAVMLWHQHARRLRAKQDYCELLGRVLRDHTGFSYGREFCRSLIRYYERV